VFEIASKATIINEGKKERRKKREHYKGHPHL
jgi:hypothetical protein